MPRLPQVPRRLAVLDQVQSSISAADIETPYRMIAGALANVGGALKSYQDSTDTGLLARGKLGAVDVRNKLAVEANGDPVVFDKGMNAARRQAVNNAPRNLRDSVDLIWETERVNGRGPLMQAKHDADIEGNEGVIQTERSRLQDFMGMETREGRGTGEAFVRAQAEWMDLTGHLRSNPEYSFGPGDALAAEDALARTLFAETVVGQVIRAPSIPAAQAIIDDMMTDTKLNLTPAERAQVRGYGTAQIEVRLATNKAEIDQLKAQAAVSVKWMEQGQRLNDPSVDGLIGDLNARGAYEEAAALTNARSVGRVKFGMTDAEQLSMLTGGGGEAVVGSRSWRNNNPGNLKFGEGTPGAVGQDAGGFAIFPDEAAGRQAMESLLFESDAYSGMTIGQAISKYAPTADNNNPERYARVVADEVGVTSDTPLSDLEPAQRQQMLGAMQRHEGWKPGAQFSDEGAAESFLIGRLRGHTREHITELEGPFKVRLAALFQAAPPEIQAGLEIFSGNRSHAKQQQLWDDSDKTGHWVARPGHSAHEFGNAADLSFNGVRLDKAPANVREWVHAHAAEFGLKFPLGHEAWHVEVQETRGGVPFVQQGVGAGTGTGMSPELTKMLLDENEQTLKNEWDDIKTGFGAGKPPTPDEVSTLLERIGFVRDPDERAKYLGEMLDFENGYAVAGMAPPDAEAFVAAAREGMSAGGFDAAERRFLGAVEDAQKATAEAVDKDAYGFAIARGDVLAPAPMDFSSPETAASGLAEREAGAAFTRQRYQKADVPAFLPEEAKGIAATIAAGGQQSQVAMDAIAQVSDESLTATLAQDPIRDAMTGAARSTDPATFTSAMQALDTLWARAPLTVEAAFGEDVVNTLQDWQGNLRYNSAEQLAHQLTHRDDPQVEAQRDKLEAAGEELARKKSLGDIMSGFDPGYFSAEPGAPVDPQTMQTLMGDYVTIFGQRYAATLDEAKAHEQTMQRLRSKWFPSEVNNGKIMLYPPEQYSSAVDGSHSWMREELGRELTTFGYTPSDFGIRADEETERAVQNGELPSYAVWYENEGTGEIDMAIGADGEPLRYRFDEAKTITDARERFTGERERIFFTPRQPVGRGLQGQTRTPSPQAPASANSPAGRVPVQGPGPQSEALHIIPVNMRTFAATLFGSKADITEADFASDDKTAILGAVHRQFAETGQREGVIGYGDYGGEGHGNFSRFGENPGAAAIISDSFSDPKMRLETTLGMARYTIDAKGNVQITDTYRFDGTGELASQFKEEHGAVGQYVEAFKRNGVEGLLNLVGNSVAGGEDSKGRRVRINLGKLPTSASADPGLRRAPRRIEPPSATGSEIDESGFATGETTGYFSGYPMLEGALKGEGDFRQGAKGPEVEDLQAFLREQGATDNDGEELKVDGSWGPKTQQALTSYALKAIQAQLGGVSAPAAVEQQVIPASAPAASPSPAEGLSAALSEDIFNISIPDLRKKANELSWMVDTEEDPVKRAEMEAELANLDSVLEEKIASRERRKKRGGRKPRGK